MATSEGYLVASTNRGCKAIYLSGGASAVVLRDGMTRAPVVRFNSAKRASQLKFYLEDPQNFDSLAHTFNKSSRFARLQNIKATIAGKNLYTRFTCSTGDAMGTTRKKVYGHAKFFHNSKTVATYKLWPGFSNRRHMFRNIESGV